MEIKSVTKTEINNIVMINVASINRKIENLKLRKYILSPNYVAISVEAAETKTATTTS